jgi:hypothetical protein
MTVAMTARSLHLAGTIGRLFALPRRGHVPPRGDEREEWHETDIAIAPSSS